MKKILKNSNYTNVKFDSNCGPIVSQGIIIWTNWRMFRHLSTSLTKIVWRKRQIPTSFSNTFYLHSLKKCDPALKTNWYPFYRFIPIKIFFNDFRTLVKNGLGWQIEWQTDSQKDRQREKKTDRQTGRPIARSKMVKQVHICYHVKWAQNTSTKINMLMF